MSSQPPQSCQLEVAHTNCIESEPQLQPLQPSPVITAFFDTLTLKFSDAFLASSLYGIRQSLYILYTSSYDTNVIVPISEPYTHSPSFYFIIVRSLLYHRRDFPSNIAEVPFPVTDHIQAYSYQSPYPLQASSIDFPMCCNASPYAASSISSSSDTPSAGTSFDTLNFSLC